MNRLERQATAYLLTRALPDEVKVDLRENPHHDLTNVVQHLVASHLEPWQYLEVKHGEVTGLPEKIVEAVDDDTLVAVAEDLAAANQPRMAVNLRDPLDNDWTTLDNESTPDEYREAFVDERRAEAVASLRPILDDHLPDDVPVDATDVDLLAEAFIEEVGLWKWASLVRDAEREGCALPGRRAAEWVLGSTSPDALAWGTRHLFEDVDADPDLVFADWGDELPARDDLSIRLPIQFNHPVGLGNQSPV